MRKAELKWAIRSLMWSLSTHSWLPKTSPPFAASMVLTVVVVGHKCTNTAILSGQQVNSLTKQLTTRWCCQLKGQRAFEMMPPLDRNTDLSWSHDMPEHWHCFSGLWPQLIVLMRQSHTGGTKNTQTVSDRVSHLLLYSYFSLYIKHHTLFGQLIRSFMSFWAQQQLSKFDCCGLIEAER